VWYLQLLKILLSKPTIPKLFARQLGWQGALSRLFICHTNTGATSRWLTNRTSASGQQLVLPIRPSHSDLSLKRQLSASSSLLPYANDVHQVDFDCELEDDNVMNKVQFDDFLADPYRRASGDDDDELDALQSMRTSDSCTFSEGGGSTPLMRSLSSTDWSQLRYQEADDKVASALMTMGLAATLTASDSTDRIDQTEELCQNLLIVLFTVMWKGIDSTEESAWKVLLFIFTVELQATLLHSGRVAPSILNLSSP